MTVCMCVYVRTRTWAGADSQMPVANRQTGRQAGRQEACDDLRVGSHIVEGRHKVSHQ